MFQDSTSGSANGSKGEENMYSWIFMVPVKYGEVDIPVLEKLAEKISIFRTLLERIIE